MELFSCSTKPECRTMYWLWLSKSCAMLAKYFFHHLSNDRLIKLTQQAAQPTTASVMAVALITPSSPNMGNLPGTWVVD